MSRPAGEERWWVPAGGARRHHPHYTHLGPGLDLHGMSVSVAQHLFQQRHRLLRLLGGSQAGTKSRGRDIPGG